MLQIPSAVWAWSHDCHVTRVSLQKHDLNCARKYSTLRLFQCIAWHGNALKVVFWFDSLLFSHSYKLPSFVVVRRYKGQRAAVVATSVDKRCKQLPQSKIERGSLFRLFLPSRDSDDEGLLKAWIQQYRIVMGKVMNDIWIGNASRLICIKIRLEMPGACDKAAPRRDTWFC